MNGNGDSRRKSRSRRMSIKSSGTGISTGTRKSSKSARSGETGSTDLAHAQERQHRRRTRKIRRRQHLQEMTEALQLAKLWTAPNWHVLPGDSDAPRTSTLLWSIPDGRPADPHLRAAVATKIARQKESAIEAATAKALEVSVCVCVFAYLSERPKKPV